MGEQQVESDTDAAIERCLDVLLAPPTLRFLPHEWRTALRELVSAVLADVDRLTRELAEARAQAERWAARNRLLETRLARIREEAK